MLSQLYPERLNIGFRDFKEVEYGVFMKDKSLQILLTPQSNDPRLNRVHQVEIAMNAKIKKAVIERIDDTHCNPKQAWIHLGKPNNLSKKQVEDIKEKTRLKKEDLPFKNDNNEGMISLNMSTNDVALLTVELE